MASKKPGKARRRRKKPQGGHDSAEPVKPGQRGLHTSKSLVNDTLSKIKFPLLKSSKEWSRQQVQDYLNLFKKPEDCPYDSIPREIGNKITCTGGKILNETMRVCEHYEKCLIYNSLINEAITEETRKEVQVSYHSTERKSNSQSKENEGKTINNAGHLSFICGAKTVAGGICRQPVSKEDERCRIHTGGVKHDKTGQELRKNYRFGIYSKYATGDFKKYLEEMSVEEIQSLDNELAGLKVIAVKAMQAAENEDAEIASEGRKQFIDAAHKMAFIQDKKYQILERTRGMVTIEIANTWIKTIMKIAFDYIDKGRRAEFTGEVKDRLNIG